MRAHTTTGSRPKAKTGRAALAIALAALALAIPATAGADPTEPIDGWSHSYLRGSDAQKPGIAPGANEPGVASSYSSVNAITGAPSDASTFATASPAGTADGFDWTSALVGAGAALALAALGTAAMLTFRRSTGIPPTASAS